MKCNAELIDKNHKVVATCNLERGHKGRHVEQFGCGFMSWNNPSKERSFKEIQEKLRHNPIAQAILLCRKNHLRDCKTCEVKLVCGINLILLSETTLEHKSLELLELCDRLGVLKGKGAE